MFNPSIALKALKKPMQTFAYNLVQKKLAEWKTKNPRLYNEAVALVSGKTDQQLKVIADGLAKDLNIDLGTVAEMFGFKI